MRQYLDLLDRILKEGAEKTDRTGTGTVSIFGHQMRFDLQAGFPLLTTKKLHLKSIIYELLWFLKGDTNVGYLQEHGVKIWNEWADANGDLGHIYGYQWRSWPRPDGTHLDQIAQVIHDIKNTPIPVVWWLVHGMREISKIWLWLLAMLYFSFMSLTESCPVSCTNAVRIPFWGCLSI